MMRGKSRPIAGLVFTGRVRLALVVVAGQVWVADPVQLQEPALAARRCPVASAFVFSAALPERKVTGSGPEDLRNLAGPLCPPAPAAFAFRSLPARLRVFPYRSSKHLLRAWTGAGLSSVSPYPPRRNRAAAESLRCSRHRRPCSSSGRRNSVRYCRSRQFSYPEAFAGCPWPARPFRYLGT